MRVRGATGIHHTLGIRGSVLMPEQQDGETHNAYLVGTHPGCMSGAVDVLRWGPAGSPPAHTVAPSTYVVSTTGGWVTHPRSRGVSYSGRCGTGCVPLGAQMGTLMGTSRGPGSNAERDNPQMPGWMPRWAHLGPTLRPTDALVEWHADVPWQLWMWGCTVSPMQHVGLRTHGIHSVTGCPTVSTNTSSTGRMQGCYPHTPRMLPA